MSAKTNVNLEVHNDIACSVRLWSLCSIETANELSWYHLGAHTIYTKHVLKRLS